MRWAPNEEGGGYTKVPVARPGSKTKEAITDPAIMMRIDTAARALGPSYWSSVTILRRTGMHPSSLVELRAANVVGGVLAWTRPKTGKRLRAKVDPELAAALAIQFAGGPRTYIRLYQMVRQVGVHANVRGLSPMTFRHSRAVNLLNANVSPIKVAQVLGCSMSVLLRHYGVMTDDELLKVG
jgi:hypothetical protein